MTSILTDSLEKVPGDSAPRPAKLIGGFHASGFLDEVLTVQVAVLLDESCAPDTASPDRSTYAQLGVHESTAVVGIDLSGAVVEHARVCAVRRVPASFPAPENADEHYLATAPGDYPDLLEPVTDGTVQLTAGLWEALWIDVCVDDAEHRHGSVGPEYREAISRVDELVRCMWKTVDERVRVHSEDWLLATVTDHGHKPGGGHGEGEEGARRSFLSLHSDTVEVPTCDRDQAPTDVVPLHLELTR